MNEKGIVVCARRWKNVGKRVSLLKMCFTLLQALITTSLRDSGSGSGIRGVGILQGVTRLVIAFIVIASNTISVVVASDSQLNSVSDNNNNNNNGDDLNAIAAFDTDSDYLYDAIDKRFYRNLNLNSTSIVAALPYASTVANLTGGDSDNGISENVTISSFGSIQDLLFATMQNPLSAIKSNDTNDFMSVIGNLSTALVTESDVDFESTTSPMIDDQNNYWALSAIFLVVSTAAGNILVCLAIAWERRLQNVTNYFLMSLAITDLMVIFERFYVHFYHFEIQ